MGSTTALRRSRHAARSVLTSRTLLGVLAIVALANAIMFGFQRWVALPLHVPSASMEPALQVGDRILVRRSHESVAALTRRLDRGDVLVFRAPTDARPLVVKRVIGLPGETIEARDGVIAINNEVTLIEKWLPESEREPGSPAARSVDIKLTRLRADEVFLLGDNRESSVDSRNFGPVKLDDVVGTVLARFWPPNRIGTVDWT